MSDYRPLFEHVYEPLKNYNYAIEDKVNIPNVSFIAYVVKPHPLKIQNICVLIEVPDDIPSNDSAKLFFTGIRTKLLDKYGNAFLWKELEICFVVVCGHNTYEILKEDEGRAVNQAGFSLNAMMGSCFIDVSNYDTFNQSTWGIYFSGDHYKSIRESVASWCKEKAVPV